MPDVQLCCSHRYRLLAPPNMQYFAVEVTRCLHTHLLRTMLLYSKIHFGDHGVCTTKQSKATCLYDKVQCENHAVFTTNFNMRSMLFVMARYSVRSMLFYTVLESCCRYDITHCEDQASACTMSHSNKRSNRSVPLSESAAT